MGQHGNSPPLARSLGPSPSLFLPYPPPSSLQSCLLPSFPSTPSIPIHSIPLHSRQFPGPFSPPTPPLTSSTPPLHIYSFSLALSPSIHSLLLILSLRPSLRPSVSSFPPPHPPLASLLLSTSPALTHSHLTSLSPYLSISLPPSLRITHFSTYVTHLCVRSMSQLDRRCTQKRLRTRWFAESHSGPKLSRAFILNGDEATESGR